MIGPIPAIPTGDATPWMDCDTAAPTRPVWGGYLPCLHPDGGWTADTSATRLRLDADGWHVERPDRPCRRAVVIACDAILAGANVPPGVLPEEEAAARALVAAGERAWAWAASTMSEGAPSLDIAAWRRAEERRAAVAAAAEAEDCEVQSTR